MNKTTQEFFEKFKKDYMKQENCMYDFLANETVPSCLTMEEAFLLYANLMNWAENDDFYRINYEDDFKEDIIRNTREKIDNI